jgi:hypothetical protein
MRQQAIAEFHAASDHAGPAAGCGACAEQLARQREAATALRRHQRRIRQQIDRIQREVA